jgi:hypothetical protein
MGHHAPRIRRRAGALVLLLATIGALTACGTGTRSATSTPTVTTPVASPTPMGTPTVLFQADWSHGLAGWSATPGLSVTNGVLVSDAGLDRAFTIPYRPAGPDYSLEFQLQIVSVPVDGAGEIFIQAPATSGQDGFIAGGYHLLTNTIHTEHNHPLFGITIDPPGDNQSTSLVPFRDYEHNFSQHTYRVEVRGPAATFIIDGHAWIATHSNSTATLSTGPFQFTCGGVALRLSALRILSA